MDESHINLCKLTGLIFDSLEECRDYLYNKGEDIFYGLRSNNRASKLTSGYIFKDKPLDHCVIITELSKYDKNINLYLCVISNDISNSASIKILIIDGNDSLYPPYRDFIESRGYDFRVRNTKVHYIKNIVNIPYKVINNISKKKYKELLQSISESLEDELETMLFENPFQIFKCVDSNEFENKIEYIVRNFDCISNTSMKEVSDPKLNRNSINNKEYIHYHYTF